MWAPGTDTVVVIDANLKKGRSYQVPGLQATDVWALNSRELFIAGSEGDYLELEFGPYGHYLALSFSGVRAQSGGPHAIRFRTVILKRSWIGTAQIDRALLPAGPHRLNATTIHGVPGRRRHLSWQVLPGEKPDFHQPEQFAEVVLP
jgi:hypothetical protein